MKLQNLSWGERFALINHYRPDDTTVCRVFGLAQQDLDAAKALHLSGTIPASKTLDVSKYNQIFASSSVPQSSTVTVHTKQVDDLANKPTTAVKKDKTPGKRGRKGDKIARAFQSIPTIPVPVEEFMKEHSVSLAVLRQHKRFDKTGLGPVNVKQDKTTKVLMIWREITE